MMQFIVVTITGVETNPGTKIRDVAVPKVPLETANIVVKTMTMAIVQHLAKSVPNVEERIILNLFVKVVPAQANAIKASLDLKKGSKKGKKSHEVNETDNDNGMDDLADQVQSLFYHDVHFNDVNTRMHTELGCEMSQSKSQQVFKIDTGADGNLMPITMFMKLYPKISLETLSKTIDKGITLFAYNNTPIKQYGTCSVKISFKGRHEICKFYVVEHSTAILGVSDSEKLGLVKVNFDMIQNKSVKLVHSVDNSVESDMFKAKIESEFPELFKGIGCIEGEISIKLKEGTIPHVEPIRRVPHAMQELLKAELDKLCKEGILHKVDISEPIEYLNSFVRVKKSNGKIRLYLDPTHLNKWIIRPRHSAKLADDILHRLNGAKYFTVVDSTSSFFNHKLDEESSKLTTFGTPFGRYRYLRMLSSDVYQYKVDGHLENIKQCIAIADDIIIYGFDPNGTDHDATIRQVMAKANQVGMRFNPAQC